MPRLATAVPLVVCLALLRFAGLAACSDGQTVGEADGGVVCPLTCDDQNVCTEDRCDDAGQCIHVPREATNACRTDDHCDDGDPCSVDTCGYDPECPDLQRCQHAWVENCRSCGQFNPSCEDGDACTTDVCGPDFLCRYTAEPLCDRRCAMWTGNFYQPSNALEGDISLYGRAVPLSGTSCVNACECSHALSLTDDFAWMNLSGLDTAWTCALTATCATPVVACAPLAYDREYVLYGHASSSTPPAAGAAFVPAPQDAGARADVGSPPGAPASNLAVEGYCMALTDRGLNGHYAASFLRDGEIDPLTFDAEVFTNPSDGSPMIRISKGAPRIPDQLVYQGRSQSTVSFGFQIDTTFLNASLFPGRDRLQGPVIDMNQVADGADKVPDVPVPPPPQFGARVGTMTLVLTP